MEDILKIEGLTVDFSTEGRWLTAVDAVEISMGRGETVGLIGESGCGKSVTALSILRLIPNPPGRISGGRIIFDGNDLLALPHDEMHKIRGRDIAMIFQEPMTSLNPVYTIGKQVREVFDLHFDLKDDEKKMRSIEILTKVGIPDPKRCLSTYPHELSGGMRQRVMIAMAIACQPSLLIADEPTTALDVTIQAQVLDLIGKLKDEMDTSVLFITHDLGVVAQLCSAVFVMYAGSVIEHAQVRDIFKNPAHPYTRGLLDSLPKRGQTKDKRLLAIEGVVPDISVVATGCKFADRCFKCQNRCREERPVLMDVGENRKVACFYPL